MSITGISLVLFLLFHLAMNLTAVFSADAYNLICGFLGANWYAVLATVALGALVAIHFIYAAMITLQNRKARGKDRYAIDKHPKGVSWSSRNMFVLGFIICCFFALHIWQFWCKMMFAELTGAHEVMLNGTQVSPQDGHAFIVFYFSQLWVVILYLAWYTALWFHLTHGIWSAFQSLGVNNQRWLVRWRRVSDVAATVIMLGFAFITITFYLKNLL
jgi:succinate dehydrogenase / fumarate reductase cytochrome b subunit